MTNYVITGKAGSGKDTAAEMFSKETQLQTYALADPIKGMIARLFNISIDRLYDQKYKELELLYTIDVTSLEGAGMYYNELGLDKYQEFHDAWEEWIDIFGLRQVEEYYQVRITIRELLQKLGTDWGRSKSELIWLDLTPPNVLVTDIRFNNEAQYFIDKDYLVIEIVRDGAETTAHNGHSSEAGISPLLIDTVIYNDATLNRLYEKVVTVLVSEDIIEQL